MDELQKYIRLILENHCDEDPRFFYVGFSLEFAAEPLVDMYFDGMGGVSTSEDIARHFARGNSTYSRDAAYLQMPSRDFLASNDAVCVDYLDADLVLKDNGKIYNRIKDGINSDWNAGTIAYFLFIGAWKKVHDPHGLLGYEKPGLSSVFAPGGAASHIKLGNFDSVRDVVMQLAPKFQEFARQEDWWGPDDVPPEPPIDELVSAFSEILTNDIKNVAHEEEWVLVDRQLVVPHGSTLYIQMSEDELIDEFEHWGEEIAGNYELAEW